MINKEEKISKKKKMYDWNKDWECETNKRKEIKWIKKMSE